MHSRADCSKNERMAHNGPYRDELAAAHARIRELEEKLAAAERPASELAADWIASLHDERARLIAATERRVPLVPRLVAFGIPATMSGVAIVRALSAPSVVPVRVVAPLLVLAVLALWGLARRSRVRARAIGPKLAAIDARIEHVCRTAALVARTKAGEAPRISPKR